jgi:hypothetical protein
LRNPDCIMPATESARSKNARNFYRLFNESGYILQPVLSAGPAAFFPVSGSTIPIRIGVSPLAWMTKGDENCTAASAALVRKMVRRSTGQDRCEVPILSSQTR